MSHDSTKSTASRYSERSLSPWASSPAGFVVQHAGGLSDFDGSPEV